MSDAEWAGHRAGSAGEAGSQESWPQRFYFFGSVIRLEAECFSAAPPYTLSGLIPFPLSVGPEG